MAVGSGGGERSLEQTPTWAVVVVCSAFVIISILIEQAIHHVGTWLSRRHKKALYDALEKLKAELMLMGFISFLLTVLQKPISKICIPKGIAYSMLPCPKDESMPPGDDHCSKQDKYPLVSLTGLNQLHYFIFTLATLHVLYSVVTIALARAKMRRWKAWEKEIVTLDYQFSHDPSRFRLTQQTSFVRRHMTLWSRTPILKWVIVLIVGMKLQLIILEMALEIQGRHAVVKGVPVVQLTDKLFWFGRPQLIIFLIHFTLFQNAFLLAFFLWTWWQFGLKSCFHERFYRIMMRIVIGVVVQFICSYVTLPLYALVTQMGSHMKNTIFEERIASGLRRWHQRAKKNRKKKNSGSGFSSRGGTQSVETTPSHGSSPLHLMRRYNTMGDIETPDISPRYYHSEYNTMGDIETPDISPRYYHSKYGATESPSYSKATEEHPISKQIETSNLEMVASSAYPLQVIKDATEQHSISKDVNINSRDFSFDKF